MTKAQILIVEDDRIVAEDIQSSLQNLGYTVSAIAPSGAEALVKVKEGNPDLVLMDIVLKGKMNGIEAADQIRSQFDIPVVYLTAYADEELLGQAKITEPFGYILKPFEERELNTVIELALYKHKMEKRLKESEEEWKSITENSPDYIMTLDPDANILFINDTLPEVTREQVIGTSFYDHALPEYKEVAEGCFEGVLKTGKPGGFESVYEDPNGDLHFFESYVGPVLQSGKVVGLTVSSRDVTERKRAEVALQESEEKYRSMMEAMTDPVYICSPDFRVEYMNTSMIRRTGRDATGGLCYEAINDLKEKCSWCVHEKIQKGEHAETEVVSPKDGHTYNVSHSPIFHVDGSVSKMTIYRDVTKHHRTEESLRNALGESQQRRAEVSGLLEGSRAVMQYREFKDAAWSIFNSCKKLIGATAGYVALLSADGAENELVFLESGGIPCTVNPSLPMPIRGLREQAYRTNKAVYENDFSHSEWMKFMPKGHASLDNVLFTPLVIEGKTLGLLGLANKPGGFTENDARIASAFGGFASVALHNSRTWELLENSEEHFRSVAETANDAIVSIDGRGNIVFWNDSGRQVFGYSADEVVGKPLNMLMPERLREKHEKGMNGMVGRGGSNLVGKTIEMTGLRKDGTEFPLELSLATWNTKEDIFYTGIVRDITERKQAEQALLEARDTLEQRVRDRTAELEFLSSRLLEVQEDERTRIAGDLHDGLGQSLSAIKFSVEGVLDR
ncbi:MAG: PAS domain S-box protein, partial [Deltaproteobacteria bacterium]|nr:PAS domain S-box protein [Deltaproteobacteria bacterium]